LLELLPRVHIAWQEQRDEIADGGRRVFELVDALSAPDREPELYDALARECADWLARAHDPGFGGFGGAPKFPRPRTSRSCSAGGRATRRRARGARHGARTTGRDARGRYPRPLGGGFHRYATDREWLVPHFEKMLYDQALIADALWTATRSRATKRTHAPRAASSATTARPARAGRRVRVGRGRRQRG